jgi:hypothetical protein
MAAAAHLPGGERTRGFTGNFIPISADAGVRQIGAAREGGRPPPGEPHKISPGPSGAPRKGRPGRRKGAGHS